MINLKILNMSRLIRVGCGMVVLRIGIEIIEIVKIESSIKTKFIDLFEKARILVLMITTKMPVGTANNFLFGKKVVY